MILSIAVTGAFSWFLYGQAGGAPQAYIQSASGSFVYPLSRDRVLDITGPLGTSHVEILHGQVRISDSPCANQLCVHMGAISRPGAWVACLPNRLFVRIGGSSTEGGIDASTW